MSKNLSDIFPPTEIGGGGGGIEEAPKTGKLYARKDAAWQEFDAGNLEPGNNDNEVLVWDNSQSPPEWMPSTTVPTVRVQETAPLNPKPGAMWMEVPSTVDEPAMMWVYDGDKWLEHPSGVDGAPGADGNIQDATEDGVIATWNNTDGRWTPEGNVSVSNGDLYVTESGSGSEDRAMIRAKLGSSTFGGAFFHASKTDAWYPQNAVCLFNFDDAPLAFGTNNNTRLTIDSSGDATFSGTVTARDMVVSTGAVYRGLTGDFGGVGFGSSNGFAELLPCNNSGRSTDGAMDIGRDNATGNFRWRNAYFAGSVYATNVFRDGSVLTSAKDLIETLATLREATKDETTLEGLRDAIGNAVGGLIEKFEAMQNEAVTQDIQESTATQEITNED